MGSAVPVTRDPVFPSLSVFGAMLSFGYFLGSVHLDLNRNVILGRAGHRLDGHLESFTARLT